MEIIVSEFKTIYYCEDDNLVLGKLRNLGFHPSEDQLERLEASRFNFCDMSLDRWLHIANSKGNYNRKNPILFDLLSTYPGNNANILRDQKMRAKEIVESMIRSELFVLKTMDGHGRFVLCFFNEICERELDPSLYTIELYDLNEVTHRWHELFMPKSNVKCFRSDILDSLEETKTTEDEDIKQKSQLYLNFCGISGNDPDDIKNCIYVSLGNFIEPFISFSTRRRDDLEHFKDILLDEFNVVEIGYKRRGNFKTYKITHFYTLEDLK